MDATAAVLGGHLSLPLPPCASPSNILSHSQRQPINGNNGGGRCGGGRRSRRLVAERTSVGSVCKLRSVPFDTVSVHVSQTAPITFPRQRTCDCQHPVVGVQEGMVVEMCTRGKLRRRTRVTSAAGYPPLPPPPRPPLDMPWAAHRRSSSRSSFGSPGYVGDELLPQGAGALQQEGVQRSSFLAMVDSRKMRRRTRRGMNRMEAKMGRRPEPLPRVVSKLGGYGGRNGGVVCASRKEGGGEGRESHMEEEKRRRRRGSGRGSRSRESLSRLAAMVDGGDWVLVSQEEQEISEREKQRDGREKEAERGESDTRSQGEAVTSGREGPVEALPEEELWWQWKPIPENQRRPSEWNQRVGDVDTMMAAAMAETGQIKLGGKYPTYTEAARARAKKTTLKQARLIKEEADRERKGMIAYYKEWARRYNPPPEEVEQKSEVDQLFDLLSAQTRREYLQFRDLDLRLEKDPLIWRLRPDQVEQVWGGDPVYPTKNYEQDPNAIMDFTSHKYHEPTPELVDLFKESGRMLTREQMEEEKKRWIAKSKPGIDEDNRLKDDDQEVLDAVDIGDEEDECT
ncbi:hypothetical protein CBR_g48045 [Chara braunii]|uniref:Uncharacterized protein n=1 Tax=Chara braunii TaxID=69332 RepID=A0A388M207_CHABU|nr:hypothetical protein CBR_g48045 [Chara braunii]|eukprot:GBG88576.1 hypothetical protein CBR_g48045 [Chara braunii]